MVELVEAAIGFEIISELLSWFIEIYGSSERK